MITRNRSIARVSIFALGAVVAGLPVGKAVAAPPEESVLARHEEEPRLAVVRYRGEQLNSDEAEAKAQQHRWQAERYRALGGVAYKTGLVQRSEAEAARYSVLAAALRSPVFEQPTRSPEADYYARLADQYRQMGGVAYKTGLVQWAEAQQRNHEASPSVAAAPAAYEGRWDWRWGKPVERSLAR